MLRNQVTGYRASPSPVTDHEFMSILKKRAEMMDLLWKDQVSRDQVSEEAPATNMSDGTEVRYHELTQAALNGIKIFLDTEKGP